MSAGQAVGIFQTHNISVKVCFVAVLFVYSVMLFSVTEQWQNDRPVLGASPKVASQKQAPTPTESQYTKSNMFMLKDAFCNFTNGDLVCHRATGFRYLTK